MMPGGMRRALFAPLVLLAACSRGDPAAKHRLFAREEDHGAALVFDPARPESSLALTADEVASRLGSFEWTAAVEWSVTPASGSPLHVTEQHRVRQASTGEFEVRADLDPGLGPSAVEGKELVYLNGMTYARALPAPFRERPTDRGRDARRFRDDSFRLVRSVADLVGPGLRIEREGSELVEGRQAFHYRMSLSSPARPGPSSPPPGYQADDPDTALRQGFLRGATPQSADGELALDARTGAPLKARLSAAFVAPAGREAGPRVSVVVSARVVALGGEVKAIVAPSGVRPDERKPAGPSTALEAAGLKKRGEERPAAEPSDEGD